MMQIKYKRTEQELIEVTDIKALPMEKLPVEYVESDLCCYQNSSSAVI